MTQPTPGQLMADYISAFKAANPRQPTPSIVRAANDTYTVDIFGSTVGSRPKSAADLIAMTGRLRERANSAGRK